MKKVSVQFNLVVDDRQTHAELKGWIKESIAYMLAYYPTSIQINNTEKRGKR